MDLSFDERDGIEFSLILFSFQGMFLWESSSIHACDPHLARSDLGDLGQGDAYHRQLRRATLRKQRARACGCSPSSLGIFPQPEEPAATFHSFRGNTTCHAYARRQKRGMPMKNNHDWPAPQPAAPQFTLFRDCSLFSCPRHAGLSSVPMWLLSCPTNPSSHRKPI